MQGRFKMEYRLFTIVRYNYNYRDYNINTKAYVSVSVLLVVGLSLSLSTINNTRRDERRKLKEVVRRVSPTTTITTEVDPCAVWTPIVPKDPQK